MIIPLPFISPSDPRPSQLTPLANILDNAFGLGSLAHRRVVRLLAVAGCTLLVASIPRLETLIDLTGAAVNTALAALPFVFTMRLLHFKQTAPATTAGLEAAGTHGYAAVDGVLTGPEGSTAESRTAWSSHPHGISERSLSTMQLVGVVGIVVYLGFLCVVGVSGVGVAIDDAIRNTVAANATAAKGPRDVCESASAGGCSGRH